MLGSCFNHPEGPALGVCSRCGRGACLLCLVETGDQIFCSDACLQGRAPAASKPAGVDPLASINFDPSDPSSQMAISVRPDDSDGSILMVPAQAIPRDGSGTTILEMAPVARTGAPERDESTLDAPITAQEAFDDSTIDAPGEGPMPVLLLPSTRRATIDRQCLRHADTPAVVLCMKCAAPICTICAEDTPQGTVCSGGCRKKRIPPALLVVAAAVLIAVLVMALPSQKREAPPAETAKATLPAPPPPPPPPAPLRVPEPIKVEAPKPEPPKVEPPKPEPPKVVPPVPVPAKVEPPKPEPPKPEPPKPEPPKPEPPKPEIAKAPPPPVEPPKPAIAPEVQRALVDAAVLIRTSTPLFREAAETIDPAVMRSTNAKVLMTKLSDVEERLQTAQSLYEKVRAAAPDPGLLDRRIALLGEILQELRTGRDTIAVPRVLSEAAERIREATPLCKQVAEGLESRPKSTYALMGLQVKSKRVVEKLTEARLLYESVRKDAPNSSQVAERIARLDELIRSVRMD